MTGFQWTGGLVQCGWYLLMLWLSFFWRSFWWALISSSDNGSSFTVTWKRYMRHEDEMEVRGNESSTSRLPRDARNEDLLASVPTTTGRSTVKTFISGNFTTNISFWRVFQRSHFHGFVNFCLSCIRFPNFRPMQSKSWSNCPYSITNVSDKLDPVDCGVLVIWFDIEQTL